MNKKIFTGMMIFELMSGLAISQNAPKRSTVEGGATYCQHTLIFQLKDSSKELVWAAALKAFQVNGIEITMQNKDVTWGNEVIAGAIMVKVPDHDLSTALIMIGDGYYIQTRTPFISVSISITGMRNGQMFNDPWWTSERKFTVEKQYYEYILDQLFGLRPGSKS